jgi:hypothetical protein
MIFVPLNSGEIQVPQRAFIWLHVKLFRHQECAGYLDIVLVWTICLLRVRSNCLAALNGLLHVDTNCLAALNGILDDRVSRIKFTVGIYVYKFDRKIIESSAL